MGSGWLEIEVDNFPNTKLIVRFPTPDFYLFQVDLNCRSLESKIEIPIITDEEEELCLGKGISIYGRIDVHSGTVIVTNTKIYVTVVLIEYGVSNLRISVIVNTKEPNISIFESTDERSKLELKLPDEGKVITLPNISDLID